MKPKRALIRGSALLGFLFVLAIFALDTHEGHLDVDNLILLGKFETCSSLGFSPDGVTYCPESSRLFISASGQDACGYQRGVFEVTLDGELKKKIYIPSNFGFSITRASSGPQYGHYFLVDYNDTPTVWVFEYDKNWDKVNEFLFTGVDNPGDGAAFNHRTGNLVILDAGDGLFEVTTSGEIIQFIPNPSGAGITYNFQTGTYFGVHHIDRTLYEFTTSGIMLRSFDLYQYGIERPVGIGYGQGKLFIADEVSVPNTGGYIWIFKSPTKTR